MQAIFRFHSGDVVVTGDRSLVNYVTTLVRQGYLPPRTVVYLDRTGREPEEITCSSCPWAPACDGCPNLP